MFCGDISTANFVEEVNIIHKGGNYGYPAFEGDKCLVDNQTCNEGIVTRKPPWDSLVLYSSYIHNNIVLH